MMFKPEEIRPEYDAEEIEKLFFVRADVADLDDADIRRLLEKLNTFGLKETRYNNVLIILCAMHDARNVDEQRFINEVFLPWIGLKKKTRTHLERVGHEIARLKDFEPGTAQDAAHLANIYRSLVADLFDPYMTLLVACFQFIENKFTSISEADLANGERSKAEYLAKRVKDVFKGDTFLSGYNPLVRNAVSHSGSRGVTYHLDRVVFKNIKRETGGKAETVIWTFEELQLHTLQLMEAIVSIEASVEIFGFDCSSIIVEDFETQLNFVFHALGPPELVELRRRCGEIVERITQAKELSEEEQTKLLGQILFVNCEQRNMPCHGARFSNDLSVVCVDVPIVPLDKDDDQQVISRITLLVRYAILARSLFKHSYDNVRVVEIDNDRSVERLAGHFEGSLIDDWIEMKVGRIDVLNDGKWSLEGQALDVAVDFAALEEAELASPDQPFPRRDRAVT
jgi:hypothetical protein